MKHITLLILTFISCVTASRGQIFDKNINKDSLFQEVTKDFQTDRKNELLTMYKTGSDKDKEFLLFMLSMPTSNKHKLIQNIDSNYKKVIYLKNEYSKLVPKNYIVSIEFNPAITLFKTKESIDLKIEKNENNKNTVSQEWNLVYNSNKVNQMLKPLNWDSDALKMVKKLLEEAKCVSIENGEIATIGFARSGMGKYYYKIFNGNLTDEQIKDYNDGCTFIFYKNNIVLEYGGGAAGSQCFPDE
jgi:hypothetical protein